MNRCPLSNLPCDGDYHPKGLRKLASGLKRLERLPNKELQYKTIHEYSDRMSISGMQPKLSVRVSIKKQAIDFVERGGTFILKPDHFHFRQIPQNESLTMDLAECCGLEVPTHGLLWTEESGLTYIIKRFDRKGKSFKIDVEDGCQLAGQSSRDKYRSSIEKLIEIFINHCTVPAAELEKLFRLILFCFLTGNNDMHLKNHSLLKVEGFIKMSPVYDLLNCNIANPDDREELALPLAGKTKNLNRKTLVDYLALERMKLSRAIIEKTLSDFSSALSLLQLKIQESWLDEEFKTSYLDLLQSRAKKLKLI